MIPQQNAGPPAADGGREVTDLTRLLTWIEIDEAALTSNIRTFRDRIRPETRLQVVVKSNAYGHGLDTVSRIAAAAGVDAFGVHTVDEAEILSRLGLNRPVLILGYLGRAQAARAVGAGAEVTVYNVETVEALSAAACAAGTSVRCHVKVETGVHRQGVLPERFDSFLDRMAILPGIELAGVSTHFANIEDTTDHSYALRQLALFRDLSGRVRDRAPEAIRHCACSAAVLTMPETFFEMVRVGISLYGLWPSKETLLSCLLDGTTVTPLTPVMTWKTRIAQVKEVPGGAFVGYGCSYRATRPTRVAVLPIGYADGYDRRLSEIGHVLVAGKRAPVLGRVCMNIFMVDVTDIPEAGLEEEVVLLGRQGAEEVGAAQIAVQCNTIAYEIVARIGPHIPRIVV
jgi:alanine racemase